MTAISIRNSAAAQKARDLLAYYERTQLADDAGTVTEAVFYGAKSDELEQALAELLTFIEGAEPHSSCPGDHPPAVQCEAEAPGSAGRLFCCLAAGHAGDHWDEVDRIHWHEEGDGRSTLRRTIETLCPERAR